MRHDGHKPITTINSKLEVPMSWKEFIEKFVDNGVYAVTICDDVLDEDCWPVWSIHIKTGVVVKTTPLYHGQGVYDMPNMMGMDTIELLQLMRSFNEASEGKSPCTVMNVQLITEESQ